MQRIVKVVYYYTTCIFMIVGVLSSLYCKQRKISSASNLKDTTTINGREEDLAKYKNIFRNTAYTGRNSRFRAVFFGVKDCKQPDMVYTNKLGIAQLRSQLNPKFRRKIL